MRSSPDLQAVAWSLPDFGVARQPEAPRVDPLEEAWTRGYGDATAAGEAALADERRRWEGALASARKGFEETIAAIRAEQVVALHTLSLTVARHLIEREYSGDPALVDSLVRTALDIAPIGGQVTVRLNPGDLHALQELGSLDRFSSGDAMELRWIGDPELGHGGCVVEGPTSIVDGRLDRVLLDLYERISHG